MTNEAVVAALGSLILGLTAVSPRSYWFWASWAPHAATVGISAQAIANGLSGLAVFFVVASGLGCYPAGTGEWFGNGLVYAFGGQVVLRTQFQFGFDAMKNPSTAISQILDWLTNMLEVATERNVKAAPRKWGDDKLIRRSFDIFWQEIDTDGDLPPENKVLLKGNIDEAAEVIRGAAASENAKEDARSRLGAICATEILARRLPR